MTEPEGCLLSILIPTLVSRQQMCAALQRELARQISLAGCEDAVEVLTLPDGGQAAVGAKRNQLINDSRGRFVVFVDDDDRVSHHYIEKIILAIRQDPDADCVSFSGEITFRGRHPRRMLHSVRYREWHCEQGRYLRPPCHITPVRRSVAVNFPFAEVDVAEDMDWALRMSRERALSREVLLEDTLYFYDCRRLYAYQWLLDRTQPLRHALGLRYADGRQLRKNPAWRNR